VRPEVGWGGGTTRVTYCRTVGDLQHACPTGPAGSNIVNFTYFVFVHVPNYYYVHRNKQSREAKAASNPCNTCQVDSMPTFPSHLIFRGFGLDHTPPPPPICHQSSERVEEGQPSRNLPTGLGWTGRFSHPFCPSLTY
jgi:hypothetical protein